VRDADGGVGGVSRTGRRGRKNKRIDADVLGLDLDFDFVGLGSTATVMAEVWTRPLLLGLRTRARGARRSRI